MFGVFDMASTYVCMLCGAQCYCYLQHFAAIQQIISELHATRSCFLARAMYLQLTILLTVRQL